MGYSPYTLKFNFRTSTSVFAMTNSTKIRPTPSSTTKQASFKWIHFLELENSPAYCHFKCLSQIFELNCSLPIKQSTNQHLLLREKVRIGWSLLWCMQQQTTSRILLSGKNRLQTNDLALRTTDHIFAMDRTKINFPTNLERISSLRVIRERLWKENNKFVTQKVILRFEKAVVHIWAL